MKYLLILSTVFLLSACQTAIPVKRNFPATVDELKVSCPYLKEVPEGTTELSKTLDVVVQNYGQYKECQLKVDQWIDWYDKQKKIFDEVK